MMKKLLVLMLVLGLASVAQAVGTLDLVITSWGPGPEMGTEPLPGGPVHEITLLPSEWIDLDIIYIPGTPVLQQCSITIVAEGLGTLVVDEELLTLPEGAWDLQFSPGVEEVRPGKEYNVQYNYGFFGTGVDEGIAIDHILFHCDGESMDPVIISIVDWVYAGAGSLDGEGSVEVIGQVIVHQIPEPMTVALLGLGGLFLLRRRK